MDIILRPGELNPNDIRLGVVSGTIVEASGAATFSVEVLGYSQPPLLKRPTGSGAGNKKNKGLIIYDDGVSLERKRTQDKDDRMVVQLLTEFLSLI